LMTFSSNCPALVSIGEHDPAHVHP